MFTPFFSISAYFNGSATPINVNRVEFFFPFVFLALLINIVDKAKIGLCTSVMFFFLKELVFFVVISHNEDLKAKTCIQR